MSKQCFNCDKTDELLKCCKCNEYCCNGCYEEEDCFIKCSICDKVTCEMCGGGTYCDNNCGKNDELTYICHEHASIDEYTDRAYCPKEDCQKVYNELISIT